MTVCCFFAGIISTRQADTPAICCQHIPGQLNHSHGFGLKYTQKERKLSPMDSQQSKPLISVLVTSYNRENYIAQTIESILSQTYSSFELIISDNCSTDKTMKVAEKYAADPRVSIYQNPVNIGQFPNRNQAASYARGKYLKYVDSDDLIYPTCLEIMAYAMEKFPEAGWGLYNDQDRVKPHPFVLSPREAYEYHYFKMPIFERSPLGSIIKKSVFDAVGGFRDINMAGDFEMWHRLACHYPLVLFGSGIGWYRVHDSQEMNQYAHFVDQYSMIRKQYLTSKENPLEESSRLELISKAKSGLARQVVKNLVKMKFSYTKKLIDLHRAYRQIN